MAETTPWYEEFGFGPAAFGVDLFLLMVGLSQMGAL